MTRRHRDVRSDLPRFARLYEQQSRRQTTSRRGSQHRRSCGLLIRKLTNGQPVVVTKGQVPPDEPTAYALEELGNCFLTDFLA
jgi:hypothetical protein